MQESRVKPLICIIFQCIFFFFTAIEDDYVGPQLEDGKVTLQFMEELMEFYKQQKKLHRKFAYKVGGM